MAEDLIRYDLLVQEALRGVVRNVLIDAARNGLSGEHHFYISFRTEAPGVRMSQRLREKYPQDMTIVLQHQFWDLGVTENSFEVGLSFSGVPERLLIPFDALSGFFDPSVQFGLKFDLQDETQAAGEEPATTPSLVKSGPRGAASEPSETKPRNTGLSAVANGSKIVPALAAGGQGNKPNGGVPAPEKEESAPPAAADKGDKEAGAEVVSLDSFRKKN